MKRNFLIVADNPGVRERLAGELRTAGYSVTLASSSSEALAVVKNVAVEDVLVESNLPDGPAEELRRQLLQLRPDSRVTVLTSFDLIRNTPAQLRIGNDDYLLSGDRLLELISAPYRGARGESSLADRGNDALIQVIDVLVGVRELDDRYFGGSSHQVMALVRAVAEEMTAESEMVRELMISTLLRDVGTVAVDPAVQQDQRQYDEESREQMQAHVQSSLQLLEHIDFPWKVLPIIRHHHERYDGTGYPDGLRGREIPIGARIVAVVDAYVAMTSHRPHREALDPEAALAELIRETGQQFDPEVVEVFQRVLDRRINARQTRAKPHVLIIEPEQDYRRLLRLRLLNEGYEVTEASSSAEALERVLEAPPSMILADVDGETTEVFELLRTVREDERLCKLPFVMVSQSTDRVLKLKALREGVDEFLGKRLDLEELIARIDNILSREHTRRDGGARKSRRGISGDLEDLGLADLVQTLVIGMKTACISLRSDARTGRIWFENGSPRHAEAEGLLAESAFYEMVRWTAGEFIIEHGVRSDESTLQQDAMFLLMEGMRLMDESGSPTSDAL